MKVDAQEMWRAVKNASLFSREKTKDGPTLNLGECLLHAKTVIRDGYAVGVVDVVAALDLISVSTTVDLKEPVPEGGVFLSSKEAKDLEKLLKDQEGDVELDLSLGSPEAKEPEFWEELETIYESIGRYPTSVPFFDGNPELFTQLSRLEPKGEWPLSWMPFRHEGDLCLAYRYGPKTVGVLVPLDRDDELFIYDYGAGLWLAEGK